MSDLPALSFDEEADLTAAEYVLGVLDAPARAATEVRLKREPGFAAQVAAWEQRLAPLNDEFDAAPPPNLLPKIEARLFPVQPKPRHSWIGWLAGAAVAASLALGVFTFYPPASPEFQIELAAENSDVRFAAVIDDDRLTLTRLSGAPAAEGTSHELWLIVGDAAPLSLGLIGADGITLTLPEPAAGATLAVTLEPAGGSGGVPTGPIIAAGVVAQG